jgi:hypothetical protein
LIANVHIRLLPFVYEIEILWKFGLKGDERRAAHPMPRGVTCFLSTASTELFVLD